eukprot:1141307-Pelagomonas_calceolata.AAC.4
MAESEVPRAASAQSTPDSPAPASPVLRCTCQQGSYSAASILSFPSHSCQEQFEVVKKVVDGKEVEVKETLYVLSHNTYLAVRPVNIENTSTAYGLCANSIILSKSSNFDC